MAELAASGLTPEQLALVMELSATVAVEARPAMDQAAENKRAYDREYRRTHRAKSYESNETCDKGSLEVFPPTPPFPKPSQIPPLSPPKIEAEKREAVATCLRRAFPPPEGVSDEQWVAFRKQRKKPLNDRSYTLLLNKLTVLAADGHDPGKLVDLAIENGWETLWPPRDMGKSGATKFVSASGYEYRGSLEQVIRKAERRGDNNTYWAAKAARDAGSARAA